MRKILLLLAFVFSISLANAQKLYDEKADWRVQI